MRLHELAKEIGAESKALLKLAKELGLKIRNHSSNLAVGEIAILKAAHREEFGDTLPEGAEATEEGKDKPAAKKKKRTRRKKAGAKTAAVEEEPAPEQTLALVEEEGMVPAEEPPIAVEEEALIELAVEQSAEAESAEQELSEQPEEAVVVEEARAAERVPASGEPESEEPPEQPIELDVPVEESLRPAAHRQEPEATEEAAEGKPAPESPGKPPQVPTPRRQRPAARIVGRIELPPEEINKPRGPRPHTSGPAGGTSREPTTDEPGPLGFGRADRGDTAATREVTERRRSVGRPKDDPLSWSPDDEDDPLLQGIRIRNVQTGPHTRRPPRRVGPRRTGRRAPAPIPTGPVEIQVPVSVRDLSRALGVKANDILKILVRLGIMAHVNFAIDEDGVLEVAAALNREVNLSTEKGKEEVFLEEVDAIEKELTESDARKSRAPVVAFLGHVDHGKTSLLDYIRHTNVAAGEAGGITQSMRAYSVESPAGGKITFLDTPGHKAFTEMRARGANTTDIVVLVVAADDGVMPQTEEAIQHARAANVPIVVALNKMDRPEAQPDRVLQQLAQVEVMVEGWGGDVQVAKVSAITGDGIDDLLEKISLQAEIMDLQADPDRSARGTVIESKKDDQLGAVATVLVQEGTLRAGDVVLSGTAHGRVRTLIDDQGHKVTEVGPSVPVNLVGLNEAPMASEAFFVVENLRKAREVAEERDRNLRQQRVAGPAPVGQITLENLFESLEASKTEEVNVVLRCDVRGSLEVVRRSLAELDTVEVKVKVIRDALGGITEDDVLLALASKAVVIGFNVVADEKARSVAEDKGVEIRSYQVIYQLIDDMKAAMEGVLSPVRKELVVGHVEIREVFKVSKIGSIAGCRVMDGMIRRNSTIRVTRDGRMIYTGKLDSLRRFKEDVREVKDGLECGIKVAGYDDIKIGDVLEVIEVAEEKRSLDFSDQ